jgi:hypothetical protein
MLEINSKDTGIIGHPLLMNAYALDDPNPDSEIPTSQFFSEGNGGESRKSYHVSEALLVCTWSCHHSLGLPCSRGHLCCPPLLTPGAGLPPGHGSAD